ncbi:MAPK kinase substrate protein At1g80180-like [Phalaenopsis equestris]|uniref:MAPK kinase substrate protein At1g80180-like n=1 Tax=Phalaenopsis equestris TaxID=78828 RepID=UPI0009E5A863|nr:MAPK kinase substrate protein At1g80180-like [Phalaenopsis equestris]
MAGLQRSTETFRRSGSSGLVWEDRFIQDEMNTTKPKEESADFKDQTQAQIDGSSGVKRSLSTGARPYRTGRVSPALDPPSPKLSACGFCSIFSKNGAGNKTKAHRR